jgi:hypothetical protein
MQNTSGLTRLALAAAAAITLAACGGTKSVSQDTTPPGSTTVTALAVTSDGICAIVSGAAKCWGANSYGRLGDGTTKQRSKTVQVKGLEIGVTAITNSATHACAVVSGAAKCWGANDRGQLGNGTTSDSSTPVQVKGLESDVTAMSAGNGYTCAVVSGAAKCWGYNLDGALGSGDTAYSTTPVQVVGLESGVTEISLGEGMTCAGVNGAVKCWGAIANFRCEKVGKSGSTCTDGISPTPVQVVGLESGATAIAAGKWYSCAVVSGAAKCWGKNFDGLVNGL